MHRIDWRPFVALFVAVLLVGHAPAQTMVRVTPEVGEPGDVVFITGTNLGGTTVVRFGANVGGFAGFWVISVAPTQVSATMVTAVVPLFNNFTPPGAFPPSSPVGTIDVGGPGFANSLPFFFMEQMGGQVSTPGLGTSQGGLAGRPVVGFTINGGPPVTGNAGFVLTLENATPLGWATIAAGAPATPPLLLYLDGLVGIDLLQNFIVLQPPVGIDAAGDVLVPIPLPPTPLGLTVAILWVVIEPVTGALGISNALSFSL